jgi:density-regulated protein DRP1
MTEGAASTTTTTPPPPPAAAGALLEAVNVIYCEKCSLPLEYCEYVEDYEKNCKPWMKKNHPEMYAYLTAVRVDKVEKDGTTTTDADNDDDDDDNAVGTTATTVTKPTSPWTTIERLTKFYEQYVPEKISDVPSLLEKYAGKEDKLFLALVKKYGPEPEDPYYMDSDDDDDDEDDDDDSDDDEEDGDDDDDNKLADGVSKVKLGDDGKKKRLVKAKKTVDAVETRVIIQKITRSKRKTTTVIVGMETVPNIKLKDVSKAFSKKFAGSSSVKDTPKGTKEIIIQGDHMEDVADMIVKTFKVPGSKVYMDFDGEFVAYA